MAGVIDLKNPEEPLDIDTSMTPDWQVYASDLVFALAYEWTHDRAYADLLSWTINFTDESTR